MRTVKVGVIPAAGIGKRMNYLSRLLPKPLLPLYDKPIIHYIVNHMEHINIETIYIPIWYQKEKIIEYFNLTKDDFNAEIILLPLKKLPKGIAMSIATTEEYISEPFMVILGDDVTITPSLKNLIDTFFDKNAIVVEGVVKEESIEKIKLACCVEINKQHKIVRMIEKPTNPVSDLRGCGVYVFSNKIFDYIRKTPISAKRNEVEITDTIDLVAKDGKAFAEFINGVNININTPDDLLAAWLALKNTNKWRDADE